MASKSDREEKLEAPFHIVRHWLTISHWSCGQWHFNRMRIY